MRGTSAGSVPDGCRLGEGAKWFRGASIDVVTFACVFSSRGKKGGSTHGENSESKFTASRFWECGGLGGLARAVMDVKTVSVKKVLKKKKKKVSNKKFCLPRTNRPMQ